MKQNPISATTTRVPRVLHVARLGHRSTGSPISSGLSRGYLSTSWLPLDPSLVTFQSNISYQSF
ncbi:hypothetical protein BJX76DRAFT_339387 [Aspergillus varians]